MHLSTIIIGAVRWLIVVGLALGLGSAPSAASTLIVATTSEAVNGDTSSPGALKASPGPDGISLPEAMQAANQVPGPHHIGFDATLIGATMTLTGELPTISVRGLTIDGDIDADGDPDFTIDGTSSSSDTGIQVRRSETTLAGLEIKGFSRDGIYISTDASAGVTELRNIDIRNSRVSSGWSAIAIHIWQQHDVVISDVVIRDNELLNSGRGVTVTAASGVAHGNQISDVTIQGNTFTNLTNGFAIIAMAGQDPGNHNNLIQGLNIVANTIATGYTGYDAVSLLISAGNEASCQFNQVDQVLIAGNDITGVPVTMEFVGGVGAGATDNIVSNVSVVHNQLTGGGVQLATGYFSTAQNNRIEDVAIGWNSISACVANGVYAIAGSEGASWNEVQRVDISNNLIVGCDDAGILLHGNDGGSPDNVINDVDIVNNTIVDNGNSWAGGININTKHSSNTITGVDISSTIMWGNSGSDVIRGSLTPASVSYSLLGDSRYTGAPDNFYSDPLFVAPATPNYRLTADSPAIDKGDTLAAGAGDHDLDLAVRVSDGDGDTVAVVDIGAYEYGAAPLPVTTHTLTVTTSGTSTGTIASRPVGIDCGGDCSGDYLQDTLVSLIATSIEGSIFAGWSGGGCSGLGTCHIFMDAAKTVNAEFNNDIAPTLTLTKTVTNDSGGTAVASDFQASIGGENVNWGEAIQVDTGVLSVAEVTLDGYAAGTWGGDCSGAATNGTTTTLVAGQSYTCSITNDDIAAQLTVIKAVTNDHGGTALEGSFTMLVTGTDVSSASFPGAAGPGGTTVTLDAGAYSVSENMNAFAGMYADSYSTDCSGSISIGESKTCTVTNNDIAPVETCNINMISEVIEHSDTSYEACEILVLGPDFIAADGSNIYANSGWEIEFLPGFTVEVGATLNANVCGQSLCLTNSSPMPLGCHSCVDLICASDASCCGVAFDQACLNMVGSVCHLVCE